MAAVIRALADEAVRSPHAEGDTPFLLLPVRDGTERGQQAGVKGCGLGGEVGAQDPMRRGSRGGFRGRLLLGVPVKAIESYFPAMPLTALCIAMCVSAK